MQKLVVGSGIPGIKLFECHQITQPMGTKGAGCNAQKTQ
jgi:hypothetical protein